MLRLRYVKLGLSIETFLLFAKQLNGFVVGVRHNGFDRGCFYTDRMLVHLSVNVGPSARCRSFIHM